MRTDLTVFAKDYPEARLIVEVNSGVSSSAELDMAVQQVARYMWGANCHFGLILTPTETYVLRDDFTTHDPKSIRVSAVLSTEKLLSRVHQASPDQLSERELNFLARAWLERLAVSYERALPDDAEVMSAFFPDLVGAVAEGRVVDEVGVQ